VAARGVPTEIVTVADSSPGAPSGTGRETRAVVETVPGEVGRRISVTVTAEPGSIRPKEHVTTPPDAAHFVPGFTDRRTSAAGREWANVTSVAGEVPASAILQVTVVSPPATTGFGAAEPVTRRSTTPAPVTVVPALAERSAVSGSAVVEATERCS
jgi:hypothetical protein